jgi:hypothetical protein
MIFIDYINLILEDKSNNRSIEKTNKEIKELTKKANISILINNKKLEMVEEHV